MIILHFQLALVVNSDKLNLTNGESKLPWETRFQKWQGMRF